MSAAGKCTLYVDYQHLKKHKPRNQDFKMADLLEVNIRLSVAT